MFCQNCPNMHAHVQAPDVACQQRCGTMIKWYNKLCGACSQRLQRCEECAKPVNKARPRP